MRGSRFRAIALGTLVILVLPGCAEVSQNPKDHDWRTGRRSRGRPDSWRSRRR